MATCRACGATGDASGLVHLVTEGTRCYPCFDAYVRSQSGESPLRAAFPAIVVTDVNGMPHVFELRATLSSEGHELEAAEVVAYPRTGYRFAVVGPTTASNIALFSQLHATLREALGRRHVELTDFGWQLTADRVVSGRLEWDPDNDGVMPMVAIDGRSFTWEQLGRMLSTYEGCAITLTINDAATPLRDDPSDTKP